VDYIQKNKWTLIGEPVEVQFSAKAADYEKLKQLALAMASAVRKLVAP
jgi:hypothetical protein